MTLTKKYKKIQELFSIVNVWFPLGGGCRDHVKVTDLRVLMISKELFAYITQTYKHGTIIRVLRYGTILCYLRIYIWLVACI